MLFTSMKTRKSVIADIKTSLRVYESTSPTARRWQDREVHLALNMALQHWSGSVSLPAIYDFSVADDTYLPWYIGQVEGIFHEGSDPVRAAQQFHAWDEISLEIPSSLTSATIIFPLLNGECVIHEANITLASAYTAGDESMSLTVPEAAVVPEMGVLVVGDIWYAFVRQDYTDTQVNAKILKALLRGQTQPPSHSADEIVEIGIFANDHNLWGHLSAHMMATLHAMMAASGSPTDIENHQWYMRWWDARADELWKRYKPRAPLSRMVLK